MSDPGDTHEVSEAEPLRVVRRPRTEPRRRGTNIRIPEDLHDRVRQAAGERGVSANKLMVWAIADYLDRLLPPDQVKWTRDG